MKKNISILLSSILLSFALGGCEGMPCNSSDECLSDKLVCRKEKCVKATRAERAIRKAEKKVAEIFHDWTQ